MNNGIFNLTSQYASIPINTSNVFAPEPSTILPLIPNSVDNLVAWWDASDETTVTLNGTNVSQLRDKSGLRNHLSQTTAANQPAYSRNIINGRNAMTWSNTNHRLICNPFSYSTPIIFSVFRVRRGYSQALAKGPIVWDTFPTGNRFVHYVRENSSTLLDFSREDGAAGKIATYSISFGTVYVTCCVTYSVGHWIISGGVRRSIATLGSNGLNGISVGNIRGNPNPIAPNYNFDGQICEIVIYNQQLPEYKRLGVERYLANKWGTLA